MSVLRSNISLPGRVRNNCLRQHCSRQPPHGVLQQDKVSSLLQRSAFLNEQCNSAPHPFLHPIHRRKKKKNSQRHFFKKYIYPQQDHPEIWHNRSSFQLGQTGRRSGQAVIKSQIKHSLTHGSCTFHECRNANIFLTRHQELVHGIYA